MKQDKQDRRSLRTRSLVQTAMMTLLLEKRYEAITVRDILDRAGIGSSTFYTHYFDKEDVQTSLIELMLEQLSMPLSQGTVGQEMIPSLELFRHIQKHSQHFQAIVRSHAQEKVWEVAQTTLSKAIEQALASTYAETRPFPIPPIVVAQYLAGVFLNLLKWWIEAEMPYSPERINEIFQQLALPGVRATIEDRS